MSNHLPRRIVTQGRPSAPTVRDPDSAVNPANRSVATTNGTINRYVPSADSKPPNPPKVIEASNGEIHPIGVGDAMASANEP